MKVPTFDQFRTSRNVLFWSLHAGGWAAYGITQYLGALFYESPANYGRMYAVSAVAGFVLSIPLRYIYRRLWSQPPLAMILGVLASCYITALGLRFVINLAYRNFVAPEWQARTLFELLGGSLSTTYLLVCWSVLYFGIKFYESQRKQEEAMLKAVALAQEAQLKMLRYQLNPHFLFNTLNAISTLILDNENQKANYAVARLSEFLRYTLDQDPMKKVTLRQELEALDLYLGTERLRFGERLQLQYAISSSAMEALIPSLLLQPLLENSLKYAVSAREQGGVVRIEGRTREGWLELSVIDDGPGLREGTPMSERRGVGLRNISERLSVLYGENRRFAVANANPGVRVDMSLPLELAEAKPEALAPRIAGAASRARDAHA
jgi:signal transduction histidine kinase